MRATTGHVRAGLCAAALLLAAGCSAAGAISEGISGSAAVDSPSRGLTSLQTAPYDETGAPTHVSPVQVTPAQVTPAPAPQQQPPAGDDVLDFTSIAANFNPDAQRFIWVLPPGVHGEGPWGFTVQVRHKGEVKYEGELPLSAQKSAGGSRPEFPAGYEVIRLTGDGRWGEQTAELDKVILALIEEHGRGDGEVEFNNKLNLTLDPAAKKLYCTDGKAADIRLFVEEDGKDELISMLDVGSDVFARMAVVHACKD